MAQKVQVTLVDDLDGGTAEETVRFGFGGDLYEIDLSSANAATLRRELVPFADKARRLPGGRAVKRSPGPARPPADKHQKPVTAVKTPLPARQVKHPAKAGRGPALTGPEQNQAIREWAGKKGLAVRPRGRIPHLIVERYQAEV